MQLLPHLERRLEKCMPQWLKRIHEAKYVADLLKPQPERRDGTQKRLDIKDWNCCFVGEIYCFQEQDDGDPYGCDSCDHYSKKFFEVIEAADRYFDKDDPQFNEDYKPEIEALFKPFLQHLREDHRKIYQKCKKEDKK